MTRITTPAAAKLSGLSRAHLAEMARTGKVDAIKILGRWQLDPDDVMRLARAREEHSYDGDRDALIDSAAAGEMLGKSPSTMRRAASAGKIPAWFIDGAWWFERTEIHTLATA